MVKKGRHRRFEEARALKRSNEPIVEPCAECGAGPEDDHATWCLATEDDETADPWAELRAEPSGGNDDHRDQTVGRIEPGPDF